MKYSDASHTIFPDAPISKPIPKLTDSQWSSTGETVMQLIDINLGNRQALDRSTDRGNAMYEQRLQPRSNPFREAANLCVPIVSAEVDELAARIVGTVFQPRTITVRGNDPKAAQQAHLVEQFLNNEMEENGWIEAADTCIHLAARDGVSFVWLTWDLTTHEQVYIVEEPAMDESGQPVLDNNGQQNMEKKKVRSTFVDFDAPKWHPVELRDLLVVPNYAPNLDVADMVCVKIYMNEHDIDKLVEAGIFDDEQAERILGYVSTGQGELSYDRQGYSTYTIGGKINVVDTAVSPPDDMKMARGPVEMWVCITNLFDMDGDGHFEENIIWVHDRSRIMAGHTPYEYHRGRNIFDLSLWPRPNRIYGFSVPDRIGSMQDEANAIHNGRLDYMDMVINPLTYATDGVRIEEDDQKSGFETRLKVTKKDDYGYIAPADVPSSSVAEEQLITQYVSKSVASPQAAALSQPSGTQMNRRQAQMAAQVQSMQNSRLMTRVRRWLKSMVEFSVSLYLQYGPDQMSFPAQNAQAPERLTIPREILGLDMTYGISGLGGIMDKEGRRQDMLMLWQLGMQSQIIQSDPAKQYNLLRQVFESFDIPEVTALLGTVDEAVENAQKALQAAQAQKQEDYAVQMISGGRVKPAGHKSGG